MGKGWGVGPVWLDVTRLLSRVGRGVLTGIDRVELAYLERFLSEAGAEARYLCKTTRGFLLLGPEGGQCLADLLRGAVPLGRADLISRITGRGQRPRHQAEAALRPHALDRCQSGRLRQMIGRARSAPHLYLNTGHSDLSDAVLGGMSGSGARVAVLIHDLIPITHPETVVPDLPANFAGRIDRVRRFADLVICNSRVTETDLHRHWTGQDRQPRTVVAHLGVGPGLAAPVEKDRKSYVVLGTIEARKNHTLLLDVWEHLAREMAVADLPHLHIIGPRGWQVEDVLQRLDRHPLRGKAIFEHGALPEAGMRDHLARAQALLFPSRAEGYGFPPLEALALGTLPIVSDLPVLRETLGPRAVYLPDNDPYPWAETIKKQVDGRVPVPALTRMPLPDWGSHFETVARALERVEAEGP